MVELFMLSYCIYLIEIVSIILSLVSAMPRALSALPASRHLLERKLTTSDDTGSYSCALSTASSQCARGIPLCC